MSHASYWKEIYLAKCKDLDIAPSASRENRFLAVIKQHCSEDTFSLNEHGLGENAAKAIAKALKNEKRFTKINLSGNTLKDAGAIAIADLLKKNHYITSLDLRSNDISVAGGKALAAALQIPSSLPPSLSPSLVTSQSTLNTNNPVSILSSSPSLSSTSSLSSPSPPQNFSLPVLSTTPSLSHSSLSPSTFSRSPSSSASPSLSQSLSLSLSPSLASSLSQVPVAQPLSVSFTLSSITSLDLSALQGCDRNRLGPKGAAAISSSLSHPSCALTKLSLADNGLGNEGIQNLIPGLLANASLVHLDLSSNSIDEIGCEALCDALAPSSRSECKIEHLFLSKNNISDPGMTSIAKLVQNNTKIKTLDISSCQITTKGAQALSEGLRYNGSLTHLSCDRNQVESQGAASIAFALQQRMSCVEILSLSNNGISWKGCQEISELIHKTATLEKLDLSYNEIGEKGIEFIAETLKWNTTLLHLDISSNKILDQGGKAVASMLAINKSLQILNLRDNAMREPAGNFLASNISTNLSLHKLNLDMNDISFTHFSLINEKLKANRAKYKRGSLSRHRKSVERLKMEEERLIGLNGELKTLNEQRIDAQAKAHETISKMEQVEAKIASQAKNMEENIEESRKQITQTTNKSQAIVSMVTTVKTDKEQRYRNILAKVHKEKDTNRKLQMKLKQLNTLMQDAKIACEREVDELEGRLKIDLMDRRQSEIDLKNTMDRVNELKETLNETGSISNNNNRINIAGGDKKKSTRELKPNHWRMDAVVT